MMLDFISSRFRTLAVLCIALGLALGPGGGHRILIRGVLHWMGEPKVLDPPEDVAVLRDIEFSSEGPLTLDLFTPQSRSAAPLPVVHCPHTALTLPPRCTRHACIKCTLAGCVPLRWLLVRRQQAPSAADGRPSTALSARLRCDLSRLPTLSQHHGA